MRRSIELDRWVAALLLVGFYYNAYRYPLQINSSGTSPTYSDTPLWLSAGKYLLIALILLYAVLVRVGTQREMGLVRPLHVIGYAYLALAPVVAGLLTGEPNLAIIGFFFGVPLVLHTFSGWSLSVHRMNRLLAATIYVALAVQALQLALFFGLGRLPALAYRDSISVRFGSFLDDPNGFGLLLCWFVPFAAVYFEGRRRAGILALLSICLILTQSLTALGAFVAVAGIFLLWSLAERPQLLFPAAVGGLATTAAVAALGYVYRDELSLLFTLFMMSKEGSLAGHATSLTIFDELTTLNVLGIQPLVERWEETGYVNLVAYFGIGYLLVYLLVGLSAVARYARLVRTAPLGTRRFAVGALGFVVAVYLGNLTLPLAEIYPINLFAALLVGIASADLLPEGGDPPVGGAPPGAPERSAVAVG